MFKGTATPPPITEENSQEPKSRQGYDYVSNPNKPSEAQESRRNRPIGSSGGENEAQSSQDHQRHPLRQSGLDRNTHHVDWTHAKSTKNRDWRTIVLSFGSSLEQWSWGETGF